MGRQYIPPVSNIADWNDFDLFTQGYITAAFFTDANGADDGNLDGAETGEIAPESVRDVAADCKQFQTDNEGLLTSAYSAEWNGSAKWGEYNETQAGHDYWFTRNGHGVGYWDRGFGQVGDDLTKVCEYNEVYLVRGDDGQVYFEGG